MGKMKYIELLIYLITSAIPVLSLSISLLVSCHPPPHFDIQLLSIFGKQSGPIIPSRPSLDVSSSLRPVPFIGTLYNDHC